MKPEYRSLLAVFACALLCAMYVAPARSQNLPRNLQIPLELAAQKLPADRTSPTSSDWETIRTLETQVGVDFECNTMHEAVLDGPRRSLLAVYERTFGPEHPATARPLVALICHLAYTGRTETLINERERLATRLIRIGRRSQQPMTLIVGLDAMCGVRWSKGKSAENVADASEAHKLAMRLTSSPVVAVATAHNLAEALEAAGRAADAEPVRLDAVTLYEKVVPRDAFQLAGLYEKLGGNLMTQMRAQDARSWYLRAIAVYEDALRDADAPTLSRIALYTQGLFWNEPLRVEAMYREILKRQEQLPGSTDTKNWMTIWNLAKAARLRQDGQTAITLQRRVVAVIGVGQNDSFELELASMLRDTNRTEQAQEAEEIFRSALVRRPDDPKLLEDLGYTLQILKRFDESIGSGQIRGASYEVAAAATSRTIPPFGGYHRLKLRMSCPFRTAHRTCSNAFAPSLVHRMCPLRFMR